VTSRTYASTAKHLDAEEDRNRARHWLRAISCIIARCHGPTSMLEHAPAHLGHDDRRARVLRKVRRTRRPGDFENTAQATEARFRASFAPATSQRVASQLAEGGKPTPLQRRRHEKRCGETESPRPLPRKGGQSEISGSQSLRRL